ncbi:MAG TPA: inositol monophosphatase family protein, partial [Luteimonas sp.]|nr:inositol monophosphatase family protein [Luteimonas sp.]
DTSDRYFCVDPLDGTRGFAKGGDEFTVNIGLIEHGAASMGVVLSPTDGALYAGEPGRALRARVSLDADAPIAFEPIAASGKQGDGWRIVASRTFRHAQPAAGTDIALVVDAFSRGLETVTGELATWILVTGDTHQRSARP